MNRDWSEQNKLMQAQLNRKAEYRSGIQTLFQLRESLMDTLLSLNDELDRDSFNKMPYANADGYHSKTIAYSIWHIFRIEDIVAHSLINNDEQIFFSGDYQRRIKSPIVTTGNELSGSDIAEFSKKLAISELYKYIADVKNSTEAILAGLEYTDLKKKITPDKKEYLRSLNVVSGDEKAAWLIDYWCGKDIRGLVKMPFSRHWIMHIEACLRIKKRLDSTQKS